MELRPYQKKLVADLYQHFRDGLRSAMVFLPTGGGKTIFSAKVITDAVKRGRKALFLCHRKRLVKQTATVLRDVFNLKVAIIAAGYKKHKGDDYDVYIAMCQTLDRRELPKDIGLVVVDEAHVCSSFEVVNRVFANYSGGILPLSKCFFVGLSATPWRTNKKEGFCHLFQCSVRGPSPRALIEQGYLAKPRLFTFQTEGLEQIKTDSDGDFNQSALIRFCTEEFNARVVKEHVRNYKGQKAIAFCVGVTQAKDLHRQFTEAGISCRYVLGNTKMKDRDTIFDGFENREFEVLVSVGTLTEGFDDPGIEVVHIARPTRSMALIIQMIGRGLRPGTEECHVLDFGGCLPWMSKQKVNGEFIDDPIDLCHAPLCPTWRPKKFDMTKDCPNCGTELINFAKRCHHCQHEFIDPEQNAEPPEFYLPELTEFLSKAGKKHYKWTRSFLLNKFRARKSPANLFDVSKRHYRKLPDQAWMLGAIFGMKDVAQNMSIYRDMLSRANVNPAQLEWLMSLEFGKPGNSYTLMSGETYVAREMNPDRFKWYEYLGVDKFASESDIQKAYDSKLEDPSATKIAINYALDTGLKVRSNQY